MRAQEHLARVVRAGTQDITLALRRAVDRFTREAKSAASTPGRRAPASHVLTAAQREELSVYVQPLAELQKGLLKARQAVRVSKVDGPQHILRALGVDPCTASGLHAVLDHVMSGQW